MENSGGHHGAPRKRSRNTSSYCNLESELRRENTAQSRTGWSDALAPVRSDSAVSAPGVSVSSVAGGPGSGRREKGHVLSSFCSSSKILTPPGWSLKYCKLGPCRRAVDMFLCRTKEHSLSVTQGKISSQEHQQSEKCGTGCVGSLSLVKEAFQAQDPFFSD